MSIAAQVPHSRRSHSQGRGSARAALAGAPHAARSGRAAAPAASALPDKQRARDRSDGFDRKTGVNRKAGGAETLLDTAYGFAEQGGYALPRDGSAPDVLIQAGDTIPSACHYPNDTATSVGFGELSTDEMCWS